MVNKRLYIALFSLILIVFSCDHEAPVLQKKPVENSETILTQLIRSTVLVEDTSFAYFMKKDSALTKIYRQKDSSDFKSLVNSVSYLPAVQFENYKGGILNYLRNDKGVVANKELDLLKDAKSRRDIYVLCDSIEFIDAPKKTKAFVCDSTSTFLFIQGFDFYEAWVMDKISGNMRKDILAYAPVRYNEAKKKFLPVFFVFKDIETYEKIKTKINY